MRRSVPDRDERAIFVDVASGVGLDFRHHSGARGELHLPEIVGPGAAWIDYDIDGDLDAYLVQGGSLYEASAAGDELFRNLLGASGGGSLRFAPATVPARIDARGYGMGVAVGDVDGDGWPDIYVTNFGPNQLLRNNGDGTFADVTRSSGAGDPSWSTSATFFDADTDGWLDLYVVNYVHYELADPPECYATSSRRDYCGPDAFAAQADRFYQSRGGRGFEEVTLGALRGYRPGPGLGVVAADLAGDSRPDLYVANDGAANQLWVQRSDWRFEDEALFAGVAVNVDGHAEAGMGVDAADVDDDGDDDLFLSHLLGESNTLYVNEGSGIFEDGTIGANLAVGSLPYTSFGTRLFDFDNDGRIDLVIVNGEVRTLEEFARRGDPLPLRQPNQLYRGNGDGTFVEIGDERAGGLRLSEVSRGAAVGDADNDGDLDVLVTNVDGPARLLLNTVGQDAPWIGLVPTLRTGARDGHGTRIAVVRRGDSPRRWRRAHRDGSYASSSDPRLVIGLGGLDAADRLLVVWPDGTTESMPTPPTGRYTLLQYPPASAGRGR